MNHILHAPISVLHVCLALLSVGTGTWLLLTKKGTRQHRRVGYVYTLCMVGVCLTAFRLYYLFGHFGIVHVGALASLLLLTGGIGVAIQRPVNWLTWHHWCMSASVTGLYAAGIVESTYRMFPANYFWFVCLGLSGMVFGTGAWLIRRNTVPKSETSDSRQGHRQRIHQPAQIL